MLQGAFDVLAALVVPLLWSSPLQAGASRPEYWGNPLMQGHIYCSLRSEVQLGHHHGRYRDIDKSRLRVYYVEFRVSLVLSATYGSSYIPVLGLGRWPLEISCFWV
jgi:hypothetical protein